MVTIIEISQYQFYDRLNLRLSNRFMEYYLSKEMPEFLNFRTSFLLQFTEEKVLLEDGAFIKLIESGFRDSFSSLITAGVLVKIPERPPKGIKVEDSTTIRHQFLQLIVRFWNQLGINS